MLSNGYLLAKIGVDRAVPLRYLQFLKIIRSTAAAAAENEPLKVLLIIQPWDSIFTEPPRPRDLELLRHRRPRVEVVVGPHERDEEVHAEVLRRQVHRARDRRGDGRRPIRIHALRRFHHKPALFPLNKLLGVEGVWGNF